MTIGKSKSELSWKKTELPELAAGFSCFVFLFSAIQQPKTVNLMIGFNRVHRTVPVNRKIIEWVDSQWQKTILKWGQDSSKCCSVVGCMKEVYDLYTKKYLISLVILPEISTEWTYFYEMVLNANWNEKHRFYFYNLILNKWIF